MEFETKISVIIAIGDVKEHLGFLHSFAGNVKMRFTEL